MIMFAPQCESGRSGCCHEDGYSDEGAVHEDSTDKVQLSLRMLALMVRCEKIRNWLKKLRTKYVWCYVICDSHAVPRRIYRIKGRNFCLGLIFVGKHPHEN